MNNQTQQDYTQNERAYQLVLPMDTEIIIPKGDFSAPAKPSNGVSVNYGLGHRIGIRAGKSTGIDNTIEKLGL